MKRKITKELEDKIIRFNKDNNIYKFIDSIEEDYNKSKEIAAILYEEITKTPGNIDSAFNRAADKSDISVSVLKARYYSKNHYHYSKYFPDPVSKFNMPSAFSIIGDTNYLNSNVKNTSEESVYKNKHKFLFMLIRRILK
jgi:hypothetical protein